MAQWMSFVFLVVVATTIAMTESKPIPAEPISVTLDSYGNPIVFLREKRTAVHPYPHRAMMFTGYYRPVRRTNHGGQATGVFAQGNAVSGEAFFGGMQQQPRLKNGPEPIEEPEVSSAEAHAAPEADNSYNEDERTEVQQEEEPQEPEEHHRQDEHEENYPQENEHRQDDNQSHHKQHGASPTQGQPEPELAPAFTTEAAPRVSPAVTEPAYTNTEVSANRPKVHNGKKTKKTPVVVADDDEEEDEDDDDDEPLVPFIPFNRRRQNYPNLNNFFPMVFSFPGGSSRAGSSGGSPAGAVTAIANSYSTGKSGVASSVATAYGGSPNGKKRRPPPSDE